MKYCTHCVMPNTKPDLHFNSEGVCDACESFESREEIDWNKRKQELEVILKKYRKNGKTWDCIIPVSGGKDSHYQTIKLLELGMTPLCVVATTCDLSDIGRRNIENIKNLGVDVLEFSPNPVVRKKLNRIALSQIGDISWPEHVSIFTIPVQVATKYNVPLIIWGENSQNEYGGPASSRQAKILDRRWLEEFGGLLGLRVSDFIEIENITQKDLIAYTYPSNSELKKTGVTGLFLGYFFPWDGFTNVLIAQGHGFESFPHNTETALVNYENLDNYQAGIHEYFKFIKLGFSRATDQACLHLRRGRLSRPDAINLIEKTDGKFPWTYLGKPLEKILEPLSVSVEEFIIICDQFTNKKIFKTDSRKNLIKNERGNLIRKFPIT